ANFVSGGQFVTRYNEFGTVYYEHDFTAKSPNDLSFARQAFDAAARDIGALAQDSWKILPFLTVNVGLRWDREEMRNYLGVPVIRLSNEWQPRIGVVWEPTRDGTMKLYAFGGRFYYSLPTEAVARSFGSTTFVTT